jgi:hypothetical protein
MRRLRGSPPAIQASGSPSARRCAFSSRNGARRRRFAAAHQNQMRLLALLCGAMICDGRLRRKPGTVQFFRLAKDENPMKVGKTS